ncbi:uncharacterized protein V1513DRAFT_452278 [Lipomyces chichibuensis]|uniref:uncharacterized protein n=1 Tax=Lipomyces chichibuensis TaxID=1546026 RepID=UPI0033435F39
MGTFALHVIVVFLAAVTVSAATPAASTIFPVPSIITPHYDTDPLYKVLPPAHLDFKVAYVNYWGDLTDWSRTPQFLTRNTDLATFCSLQNRGFWFFGYTSSETSDEENYYKLTSFSSTISLAKDFAHPAWIVDNWAEWPPIPCTENENEVIANYKSDIAINASTNCAVLGPSKAIQFWNMRLGSCGTFAGTSLVVYEFSPVYNTLKITRPVTITLTPDEYQYGSFATVVVRGVVYLYALDSSQDGYHRDVHVASAPAATVEDKSTWRYWDQGAGAWSSTEPFPTARRQSAAIISLPAQTSFRVSASIFYSAYHNSYLLFFLNGSEDRLRVKYSSTPLGPWSTNDFIVFSFPASVEHALVTPVPFQNGSDIAGQKVLVSSYGYDEPKTKVWKLKFT